MTTRRLRTRRDALDILSAAISDSGIFTRCLVVLEELPGRTEPPPSPSGGDRRER